MFVGIPVRYENCMKFLIFALATLFSGIVSACRIMGREIESRRGTEAHS
jgi:hypothetical protein